MAYEVAVGNVGDAVAAIALRAAALAGAPRRCDACGRAAAAAMSAATAFVVALVGAGRVLPDAGLGPVAA